MRSTPEIRAALETAQHELKLARAEQLRLTAMYEALQVELARERRAYASLGRVYRSVAKGELSPIQRLIKVPVGSEGSTVVFWTMMWLICGWLFSR